MKMLLIGDGGHGRVIQEMLFASGNDRPAAILDDKYEHGFQLKGIIHAPIAFLPKLHKPDMLIIVAIGNNIIRKKIVHRLNFLPASYGTVVSPSATVSPSAEIGSGTVIMPGAVVNAKAKIGNHCIINSGAIIEHDATIGDYTHVCPNATLTGNVSTGEGVFVGSSATVIPAKHLGSWSVIGAGSTVIEHIPAYTKAVGSPASIIEKIALN